MLPYQSSGFIHVGGQNPNIDEPYDEVYHNVVDDWNIEVVKEDINKIMPYPRSGECFVKTTTTNGWNVYVVIGGLTSSLPDSEDKKEIMYLICKDEDEECSDFQWKLYPSPDNSFFNDLLNEHTCASFQDGDGKWKIIVVDNNIVHTLTQDCIEELNEFTCFWTDTGRVDHGIRPVIKNKFTV